MATPITSYAQVADLQVGINAKALADVGLTAKQLAIANASSVIDSFLRSHFVLPLLQVGADVKRACVSIAIYDLMSGRGYNPDANGDGTIKDRYDNAMAWLKLIAEGKATPDVTDSSVNAVEGRPSDQPIVISSPSRGLTNRGSLAPSWPFQGS